MDQIIPVLIISLSLLLVAMILLTMGIKKRLKVQNWKKINAIAVENSSYGLGYPKPIVRYEVDGVQYEVQSNISQRTPWKDGKQVQVYYNPNNPNEMVIDTFTQRGSIYFLVGSLFFVGFIGSMIIYIGTYYFHHFILELP